MQPGQTTAIGRRSCRTVLTDCRIPFPLLPRQVLLETDNPQNALQGVCAVPHDHSVENKNVKDKNQKQNMFADKTLSDISKVRQAWRMHDAVPYLPGRSAGLSHVSLMARHTYVWSFHALRQGWCNQHAPECCNPADLFCTTLHYPLTSMFGPTTYMQSRVSHLMCHKMRRHGKCLPILS